MDILGRNTVIMKSLLLIREMPESIPLRGNLDLNQHLLFHPNTSFPSHSKLKFDGKGGKENKAENQRTCELKLQKSSLTTLGPFNAIS